MSSLHFDELAVRYGTGSALAPFSTDSVKPGEWLCLIGPNGAGKSSILRAVAGLVPARGRDRGRRCTAGDPIASGDGRRWWPTCRSRR